MKLYGYFRSSAAYRVRIALNWTTARSSPNLPLFWNTWKNSIHRLRCCPVIPWHAPRFAPWRHISAVIFIHSTICVCSNTCATNCQPAMKQSIPGMPSGSQAVLRHLKKICNTARAHSASVTPQRLRMSTSCHKCSTRVALMCPWTPTPPSPASASTAIRYRLLSRLSPAISQTVPDEKAPPKTEALNSIIFLETRSHPGIRRWCGRWRKPRSERC